LVCLAFVISFGCAPSKRESGPDLETQLNLTTEEARLGKEVRVTIPERGETITVKIPAGVTNGTRLRFRGKGRPGQSGAAGGDFYVLLIVR
jgi:curved DNA-binding protein